MGWVTVIGPAQEQVEYRLKSSAGCSLHHDGEEPGEGDDAQVEYRLGDGLDEELELVWIGEGLRDVGIEPGTVLQGETDKNKARALMSGVHPGTGEQLVKPKAVTDPRGKLAAGPLLAAIAAAAEARGQDVKELLGGEGWALKRFGQAERGLKREGEVHRVSYKDSVRLAKAAGMALAGLYTPQTLELARRFQNSKTRVGLRGFDVTVDLPKSVSGLWAISPAELAKALLETHRDAVTEGFTHYEAWVSYTMRGHHGDGGAAEKVPSSGLLGWVMPHQIARPVDGAAPDPHVHTHIVIAHLAHAEDDVWRTIGGGGRDVHRMAAALDTFAKARFRALTAQRFGFQWERDERTGQWEVVGVPTELREQLSKRGAQVARELEKLGITDPKDATRMQAKVASASSREAKGTPGPGGELRTEWRRQAEATESRERSVTGPDGRIVVDLVVQAAAPGWGMGSAPPGGGAGLPPIPPIAELAARVVGQLTEHRKDFRRSDALAALLDAVPVIDTMAHAQDLVDQVLAQHDLVAQLPEQGQTHLTHHERYTSTAIVQAERTIVESAAARHGEGAALVPADAAAMAVGVFEAENGFTLSPEQRAAVDRLLTAGHGIDALIGVAGSGKTTLMSAARTGWSAAGLVVAGASTAAVAAVNLEAESGITSATLASWLMRIRRGQGLTGVDVMVLDEAAMCDDRQVAELTAAAATTGTKLVMIGDPMQLRSPGVGGSFNAVHTIVGGRVLRENRRQRDQAERAALARWRTGDRLGALLDWSGAGRVHVAEDGPTAIAAMLQRWDQTRQAVSDPFERIRSVLLLAGTNADVDKLNAGARAIRIAAGEIEAGREYRRAGGGRIEISIGDVVMTRANDYRQRKTRGAQMDVLNGYRGIVTAVTERGITVAWKDGTESELTTRYIAEGGVSHGYALTVAKSQGLTAQDAIVYGAGLDPNTLYPAMSRDRGRVDLVLPRTVLEDADTLARLGEPASEAEALRRAINAYAASLTSRDEPMVSVELGQPLPTVLAVEATRADQAEVEQQPARRMPRAAARSTQATRRPVPAEQQAEAQATPVADPEAADAIRIAAQAVSGTPSERLAASINRAQSRRTRRAEARAARPRPPANRVPATAEQVRARAARAEDDRADWPVMFTAPFGTTKAADLAAETERAGHELESWEYRERAAAAVLDAAAAGHPGRAETQLLAERVGHRERADLIAAVHRAEQQLAQAERQVEAADRETARLQAQRGERGNSVRTALRGPAAWRERGEALIAAQTERREAADRVTAAEGALRDAVAASPALSPHNPLEIRRRYWERLTTETAQFEANLPRALVAARANDTETLMRAREQGPEAHRQAEAWRARLDTLQGEAARRAALPEAERAIEDGLRGLRTVNARLLDTARAALAAADQAPEGYRPWTARTYGPLTPAGLDEREQQLRERAGEFADQGAALRERMRQEDQAVREGQGPAATRLRQGGEAARVRAERDEAADPIRAREAAAAQAAEHVQGQIQRLREQLHEHGAPWWMLNHATTPRTVRELIEQQLQPQLERHVAVRDAVRAELEALPGGHPGPAGEGREALRRYTEQLPAVEQAALARDRDRLDTAHRPLRTQAEQADHAEAATRGDLAALAAERNLRAELPTALSRAENTARSTRIGERRADARAEAAAREQYQAELSAWREQYPQEARQQETEHHHHYEAPDPGLGHGLSR